MKLTGGYTNYEQIIGVLMLDTRFPRPAGDIGNAASYRFPVRYKKVDGAVTTAECPDAGAIVLECTNMCPFSHAVAKASGLPVFDINSLINMFYGCCRPTRYF